MYLIKVDTREQLLFFRVPTYEIKNNRCTFLDLKTNSKKDFPQEICYIEELVQWTKKKWKLTYNGNK